MVSGSSRGLLAACAIIVHIGCNMAQVLPLFQCSFEDDLCGMKQRTDDQFEWTRLKGPTPSRPSGTGPNGTLDGDYYIYIDGSHHEAGKRAYIATPPLKHSGDICVQFSYHMYTLKPEHMGRLVVFTDSQGEDKSLFDEGGENKGDQWIPAQITAYKFNSGERIVFVNKERNNSQGDMALDKIDIRGGACGTRAGGSTACTLNNGGCDTRCVPQGKGKRCECDVGYHLDDEGFRCLDDNECAPNGGRGDCSHTCDNTLGSYTCSCPTGYELEADNRTCRDIDECAANGGKGDCGYQCDNTPGSFTCYCPTGYQLEADDRTCRDIDECAANGGKGDCGHQCDNTDGSYQCDCDSGYTLNGDQKSCDDDNECAANGGRGDCSHTCYNIPGSYTCSCPTGYELEADGRTCRDINECSVSGNDGTTCADETSSPTTITTTTTTTSPPKKCLADNACDVNSFPLWQLLTGIFVGAAALGAIIAVVTVCVRKRISSGKGKGRTPYENAEEIIRHETKAANKAPLSEGGVYDEVFAPDVQTTRDPNDVGIQETTVENLERQAEDGVYDDAFTPYVQTTRRPNDDIVYINAAFHGHGPYQELGPTDPGISTVYQGIN